MKIVADTKRCMGYANCVGLAPEVFDLDEAGHVVLLEESPPAALQRAALDAVASCPTKALAAEVDEMRAG